MGFGLFAVAFFLSRLVYLRNHYTTGCDNNNERLLMGAQNDRMSKTSIFYA